MGKTSSTVKNRWNDKTYDRINVLVKKGQKSRIKAVAAMKGESVNAFINRAIEGAMTKEAD